MTDALNIDRSACSGHGRCYTLAPELFEPDDEGFPIFFGPDLLDGDLRSQAQIAIDSCPERAISFASGE